MFSKFKMRYQEKNKGENALATDHGKKMKALTVWEGTALTATMFVLFTFRKMNEIRRCSQGTSSGWHSAGIQETATRLFKWESEIV